MKKAILTTLISLAFASTAFAATPAINVEPGQVGIGYTNYNLDTTGNPFGDLGNFKADNYQAAYGINNKLSLTGDYLNSEKASFYNNYYGSLSNFSYNTTAVGLQYKLNNNLAVSAGSVKSGFSADEGSNSINELYGGISYQANLTNNLAGYASYQKSTSIEDSTVGLKYGLGSNASIDVNYRNYQDSNSHITAKGVGVGVNYKF